MPQHEIRVLSIDTLQPNPWNPNVEDGTTFNELVESIKENGFVEPIQVVESNGGFVIIGGEHRWKAAKLAGLTEIPAVILDWDEDKQKVETVKLNVLRGKLDPEKFTKLFQELEKKYGREPLRKLMGLGRKDAEFRRLLREVKKNVPEEMQREIEKRADKIKNVEDLAAVVNSLYSRFGGTLQYSFMIFNYGGRQHLMVKLNDASFAKLKGLMEKCATEGRDVNEEVRNLLTKGLK